MHKIDEKIAMVEDPELIKTLVNINELTEAKENGGLLRANLSSILNRKNGINTSELNKVLSFKSRFYAFSRSSSIKFYNSKSEEHQKIYIAAPEHQVVKDIVTEVISQPEATNYSMEGSVFFTKITVLLNLVKETLMSEVDHLETVSEAHLQHAKSRLIFMGSMVLIYLSLSTFFTLLISIRLVKDFRKHLHSLNNKTMAISLITTDLNTNSKKVFEASNDQSQGIEETSAAVHEINKIQISTNELVKEGKVLTDQTTATAEKGKIQVQSMLDSINNISKSNDELSGQVNENNKSFEKVTNVINEIADKTGIINDIVFQTKLLSFNASVEAARAGEHGKGFSVVAEEIGQLATLSGNASNEIAALVSSSIELVSSMTKEMTQRMDGFVENSNKHIAHGNNDAQDCSKLFDNMLTSITKLKASVTQIESAAIEQAEAISNISGNVNQLDAATKSNLSTMNDNFKISESIAKSSEELKSVVDNMCVIIRGETISKAAQEKYNNIIEIKTIKETKTKKVA
jgi:methyl-accepting chemotaxis protein